MSSNGAQGRQLEFSTRTWVRSHVLALGRSRSARPAALVAFVVGTTAAIAYYTQGVTLSHYDAKAHLVVARRILDSMQPGWIQIGAVWLPLPHLLNALPVQVDWLYRTGFSGVALSLAGFVLSSTAFWWLVHRATDSSAAAWAAFAVFTAQPDVLYLQATPMTEPLLMGFSLLAIALGWKWVAHSGQGASWPCGGALAVPTAAVLAFLALSRATVGAWLVTDGFYEIDNATYHQPLKVLGAVAHGVRTLNGPVATAWGAAALLVVLFAIRRDRRHASLLVVFALGACLALPAYAFWNGHPFRIRYMVPFTMVLAAVSGLGVGLLPRHRRLAAAAVIVVALVERPPASRGSAMLLEAQRDRSSVVERLQVTRCLVQDYDQTPILASMASLAPYMQETSHAGFSIRQYIHEGIGPMWSDSLVSARRHAGWVLIEERAEGGMSWRVLEHGQPNSLKGSSVSATEAVLRSIDACPALNHRAPLSWKGNSRAELRTVRSQTVRASRSRRRAWISIARAVRLRARH